MATYNYLKIGSKDGAAYVTFARPKHNVLNIDMMNELNGALDDFIRDPDLKCVVLLGEGPSWCAG